MRNTRAKSFQGRSTLSSKFNLSGTNHNDYSHTHYQNAETETALLGHKRPLVANLANVPTVKIASYSKRRPETLFWGQGQAPRPSDSEGHGGLFYETHNHGKFAWSSKIGSVLPFERKVESQKDKIKRIESITKKMKGSSGSKSVHKDHRKQMAKENAEMLFNMLHGPKALPNKQNKLMR